MVCLATVCSAAVAAGACPCDEGAVTVFICLAIFWKIAGWYHPGAVQSAAVLLLLRYAIQTGELEMSSADAAEYEQVRRCVYGCCPRCDCGPLQQCCQGFCRCSVVTGAGAQGLGTGAAATECHRAQCDGAWLCVRLVTRRSMSGSQASPTQHVGRSLLVRSNRWRSSVRTRKRMQSERYYHCVARCRCHVFPRTRAVTAVLWDRCIMCLCLGCVCLCVSKRMRTDCPRP